MLMLFSGKLNLPHRSPSACQWSVYCCQLQLAALSQRSNLCLDLGILGSRLRCDNHLAHQLRCSEVQSVAQQCRRLTGQNQRPGGHLMIESWLGDNPPLLATQDCGSSWSFSLAVGLRWRQSIVADEQSLWGCWRSWRARWSSCSRAPASSHRTRSSACRWPRAGSRWGRRCCRRVRWALTSTSRRSRGKEAHHSLSACQWSLCCCPLLSETLCQQSN